MNNVKQIIILNSNDLEYLFDNLDKYIKDPLPDQQLIIIFKFKIYRAKIKRKFNKIILSNKNEILTNQIK